MKWWERLIARLERWHGARKAVRHEVGSAYRASTIDIPAVRPRYLSWIERFCRRLDRVAVPWRRIAIGLLAVAVLFGALYGMYWGGVTRSATAVVVETRWLFHVSVRERQIRNATGWHDELHAYAFDTTCRPEVRSHHDCHPYLCPGVSTTFYRGHWRTRVVLRTCYESCPDYDSYCRYSYPSWPTISNASNGGVDHTPVHPDLRAAGDQICVEDDEPLHARGFDQCETTQVSFAVQFDAPGTGHWGIVPATKNEFDQYQTGEHWITRFNHFGMFEPIGKR